MKVSRELFDFKVWHLIFLFSVVYLILIYINNEYIMTDSYYYAAFNDLSSETISNFLQMKDKLIWISYIIAPIVFLLKTYLIALAIYVCAFFFELTEELNFTNCLKVVLLAEIIPVVQMITKIVCQYIDKPKTLMDIQSFSPLSMINLLNTKEIPKYFIYSAQLFNLFELGYWFMLIIGISCFIKSGFRKSATIVAASYGSGLLVWMLILIFIQL